MKDLLIVSIGSFLGGGVRFLVSKWTQSLIALSFPLGTLSVNVLGCLLIGFLSGLTWTGNTMSPSMKLLLTTGFCGGFTTFSTFMNETSSLMKEGESLYVFLYLFGSLVLGLSAVFLGQQIAKFLA